jgi:hypothetical protein
MSSLDFPTVKQASLAVSDQPFHGEKLSVNSAEDSSPLRRGILYATLPSLFLWTAIILVLSLFF